MISHDEEDVSAASVVSRARRLLNAAGEEIVVPRSVSTILCANYGAEISATTETEAMGITVGDLKKVVIDAEIFSGYRLEDRLQFLAFNRSRSMGCSAIRDTAGAVDTACVTPLSDGRPLPRDGDIQVILSTLGSALGSSEPSDGEEEDFEDIPDVQKHELRALRRVPAVVIDSGSTWTRVGLSAFDEDGSRELDEKVFHIRNVAVASCLTSHVRPTDDYWHGLERVWHHTFYNALRVVPQEHPVLLAEPILNPKANRERMAQIIFESFDCPALSIVSRPLLLLFACGRTEGVALHSGDRVTAAVPVIEGQVVAHAILVADYLSGHSVTKQLQTLLREPLSNLMREEEHLQGQRPGIGNASSEVSEESLYGLAREIKENLAYVAINFSDELRRSDETGIGVSCETIEKSHSVSARGVITCRSERFQCAEFLFEPEVFLPPAHSGESPLVSGASGHDGDHDNKRRKGMHELIVNSVQKCGVELRRRCQLFSNIVIGGGNSNLLGFRERLQQEVRNIEPK